MAQVISLTSVRPVSDPHSPLAAAADITPSSSSTPIPIPSAPNRLVNSKRQFFENQIRANTNNNAATSSSYTSSSFSNSVSTAATMGQTASQELPPANVPYHEKHYIENNKQLQRQSSLSQLQRQNSLSSSNLLLSREPSLKRTGSAGSGLLRGGYNNQSLPSLNSPAAFTSSGAALTDSTAGNANPNGHSNTGTEKSTSSFIRLLPIETETPYYDESSESSEEDDGEGEDHAGDYAEGGDAAGHNSQHTSPHRHHREQRHARRHSRNQLQMDEQDRQRLALSSSPSDYDKAMNVNSRLNRSDSFELHPREVLDDQQTRAEEAEDLAFLSPVPGHSFDSVSSSSSSQKLYNDNIDDRTTRSIPIPTSSASSLSRSGSGSGMVRYQLHDEPVRKVLESPRAASTEGGLRRGVVDYGQNDEHEGRQGNSHSNNGGGIDQDEEDKEDQFLRRHYASLGMNYMGGGNQHRHPRHGSPSKRHDSQNEEEEDDDEDEFSDSDDDSDQDVLVLDEEEDDEDEYREVEMNQLLMEDSQNSQHHDIQLLSGSLSVRSPFLHSIQEEEEEDGDSAFPPRAIAAARLSSSVPTLSSMPSTLKGLYQQQQRMAAMSPDLDNNRSPGQASLPSVQGNQRPTPSPTALPVLAERPRGPRPPAMAMGRPRSNSSLTRLLETRDEHCSDSKEDTTATRPSSSLSDTVQDLEVKRVMEGHPAVADLATLAPSSSSSSSSSSASRTITTTAGSFSASSTKQIGGDNEISSSPNAQSLSSSSARQTPTASFGQDTQKSVDEFFSLVKQDLEERIQQAIQAVEQKFLDRVHKLEERNTDLTAAASASNGGPIGEPAEGSLMASLTRPLPTDQNPGGSIALRKEILNHVTEKVGDLDLRVNQMEVLVSYKLVDIESKVQDLHGAHNSIAQKVHQVAKTQSTRLTDTEAGQGLGQNSIKAGEAKLETAMQPYRLSHAQGDEDDGALTNTSNSQVMVSPRAVMELRQEVQALGTQYRDLNDGLLTDILSQMRDAKLMLLQTVDEVDNRISKRVDRIEAEMHARLLSEIEGRVQERVRAMEQTLSRLEHCFDKTNGRLGALETTLTSKRPRPESMYQLSSGEGGYNRHYDTISGDGSLTQHQQQRSVASLIFSDMDLGSSAKKQAMADRPASVPLTRPPLLHSDSSSPESPLPSGHENRQSSQQQLQQQNRSAWGAAPSSSTTPMPTTPSEELNLVSSPLERGTIIAGKHATIHSQEDNGSRPTASSLLAPFSSSPMSSTITTAVTHSAPVLGLGARRVSMPTIDTKSATLRSTATGGRFSAGTSATTPREGYSTVASTRAPMKRAMSMDTANGNTIRPSQVLATGSIQPLVSPTGSTAKSPTSATGGNELKQRLLGHGQGTKAGVKSPSSYRDLLHFWKAGGSTPDLLKGV